MIIGDNQDTTEDTIRLASSSDVSFKHAMGKEWSIELFDHHPCEVIVLCHKKFENAFSLCRSDIFNDSLIIKPLFDIYRSRFTIQLACNGLENEDYKKKMEHKLEVLMSKIETIQGDMESYFETTQYIDEIKENIEADAALSFDSAIEKNLDIKRINAMSEGNKKEFKKLYKEMTNDISKQVNKEAIINSKYNNWKAELDTKAETISDKEQSIVEIYNNKESKIKVLIIEDEAVNQKIISLILSKEGYDVKFSDDRLNVIKLATKWLPSLIFMDIRMPTLNGLKPTQLLKAIPKFEESHIIILTAHGNRVVMKEYLKAGASDYLVKPAKKGGILQRLDLMFPGRDKNE